MRVKESRYGKSDSEAFCRERTEDSENRIRFSIALFVPEIQAFKHTLFFGLFGTFRSISREPDFSRTCGFRQNVRKTVL